MEDELELRRDRELALIAKLDQAWEDGEDIPNYLFRSAYRRLLIA